MVTPAFAKSAPTTEYSISIVEGESTLPEDSIVHTGGEVQPKAPVALSIVRSGTVIAKATGTESVWLSQVPEIGDDVTLESPVGTVVGSVVYDGLPSIAPEVCAGSTDFSGQRSARKSKAATTRLLKPGPTRKSTGRPPVRPR